MKRHRGAEEEVAENALEVVGDVLMCDAAPEADPVDAKAVRAAVMPAAPPRVFTMNMSCAKRLSAALVGLDGYHGYACVHDPPPISCDLPPDVTHVIWTPADWEGHIRALRAEPSIATWSLVQATEARIRQMLRNTSVKILCLLPCVPRHATGTLEFLKGMFGATWERALPCTVMLENDHLDDDGCALRMALRRWVHGTPVRFNR